VVVCSEVHGIQHHSSRQLKNLTLNLDKTRQKLVSLSLVWALNAGIDIDSLNDFYCDGDVMFVLVFGYVC